MRATVRVPATVANLGPGFDMLALALQLQNEVFAESTGDDVVSIAIDGDADADAELLDLARNLVARAYSEGCSRLEVPTEQRGGRLRCLNPIPHGRGKSEEAPL